MRAKSANLFLRIMRVKKLSARTRTRFRSVCDFLAVPKEDANKVHTLGLFVGMIDGLGLWTGDVRRKIPFMLCVCVCLKATPGLTGSSFVGLLCIFGRSF